MSARPFLATLALLLLQVIPSAPAAEPTRISPSPDGRYVFLQGDASSGQPPLDLVDPATGKVLQHILQPSPGSSVSADHILWKPDSSGFALTVGTGRFEWNVSVYVRQGDTFESRQFPDMPRATIPAKYGPDTKLKHWDDVDRQTPIRWLPDGSLVVEVASTADDSHLTVTATRTVTISLPAKGPPRFLNSTLKVTTGKL
jgi:hypothetical protein